MLKRIHVHNFRTFVNFEWVPPPIAVLVGDNGSGKSSLVEVLWHLLDIVVHGKSIEAIGADQTKWLQETDQVFEIDIDSGKEQVRYRLQIVGGYNLSLSESLVATDGMLYRSHEGLVELFGDEPGAQPRVTIPFNRQLSFIAALEARPDNQRILAFRSALRSIAAIKPDPLRVIGVALAEERGLARDLSNFAAWYRAKALEDQDANDLLRNDLKAAIRGFSQLSLAPVAQEIKALRVRFRFERGTHDVPWECLSDGQRLLIALYGTLRFSLDNARLVVLDEIENYVAPQEIQPWLQKLVDGAAHRGGQVILMSHHPESINYMAADSAWRMWRDPAGGHTRIEPLSPDLEAGETAYDLLRRGRDGD